MAPVNQARRDRLADAAIEVLARLGARGLTHRAVDAEAGEPPGTTSRYFRTRDALMSGVAQRIRHLHFADLQSEAELTDIMHNALSVNRSRHLAMMELFLEATRRPELRDELTGIRRSQIALIRERFPRMSQREVEDMVATITGRVFIGLTTPEAMEASFAQENVNY